MSRSHVVYIASPFSGKSPEEFEENVDIARDLLAWVLKTKRVAPFVPHLLYPQVLPETKRGRTRGMTAGIDVLRVCDELWWYDPRGLSKGVAAERKKAKQLGLIVREILPGADTDVFKLGPATGGCSGGCTAR